MTILVSLLRAYYNNYCYCNWANRFSGYITNHHFVLCVFLCIACPTGCSLCRGPQNSACLACENTDLYRDTTNMLNTACVSQCGAGTAQSVDVFGVRTCIGKYNC